MTETHIKMRRAGRLAAKIALFLPFLVAVVFLGHFVGIGGDVTAALALLGWVVIAWWLTTRHAAVIALATVVLAAIGYVAHRPSNERDWIPEVARLPRFEVEGDMLHVENLRDFKWTSKKEAEERWETADFDLNGLKSVDAIVVPFGGGGLLAHTMLSFGFEDGRHLVVSVESRPEKGEAYSLMGGAARQLELIYVFGTERDLLEMRILYRGNPMYCFPIKADAPFARGLLLELCDAANQLHDRPRFYATLRHNCTSTLLRHVNRVSPEPVNMRLGALFPGKVGELLHRLHYIDTPLDWPSAKERFRVDDNIKSATDLSEFSKILRN